MAPPSLQPAEPDEAEQPEAGDAARQAEVLGEGWHDVEAAQTGDRAAFERLYRAYARMVRGIVLAHARWEDADDLVQDVFCVAWDRLGELREAPAFGGWLSRIARRRAIDQHRRGRAAEPLTGERESWDASEGPVEAPAAASPDALTDALAILAIIRGLPSAYRETLVLRLMQGMTGPEIALETGMTAGSVRVNLHRGMAMLRAKLEGRRHDG